MKRTIQEKVEEITCDQCNKSIYNQEPIRLNEYYRNDWESERHLCSVKCLINHLVNNLNIFEGLYHYNLSFPSGEYLIELSKYLKERQQ